jgi:hypothetical protein
VSSNSLGEVNLRYIPAWRPLWQAVCVASPMAKAPWRRAGVSKAAWERARQAVIDGVADLVWRTRGRPRSADEKLGLDQQMEQVARLASGDPESARYGLDLADARPDGEERGADPPGPSPY